MQDKPLVIGKFQTPNCVPHTIFKLVIEKPFCVTSEWYLWHCYCLSFIACKPFPAFIVFPFYVCIAAQWVKKVLWINHERMASSLLSSLYNPICCIPEKKKRIIPIRADNRARLNLSTQTSVHCQSTDFDQTSSGFRFHQIQFQHFDLHRID